MVRRRFAGRENRGVNPRVGTGVPTGGSQALLDDLHVISLAARELALVVYLAKQPADAFLELLDRHAPRLVVHVEERAAVPEARPEQTPLARESLVQRRAGEG